MGHSGHKNRNHWKVNLVLFNKAPFYRLVLQVVRNAKNLDEAARTLNCMMGDISPGGAPWSFTAIRAALRGMRAGRD
jgi:hypothetical protein